MQVTATKSSASIRFLKLAGTPSIHSQRLLMSTQRNNNCFDSKVHFMLAVSIRFRSRIKKALALSSGAIKSPSLRTDFLRMFGKLEARWRFVFCSIHHIKKMFNVFRPAGHKKPRNIVIKNGCARVRDGDYRLSDNFKLETCPSSGHFLARLITSGAITRENFSEAGRQKVQRFVFKGKCCVF